LFCLTCWQSDIVAIVDKKDVSNTVGKFTPAPRWQFTAGVVNTGGKFTTGIAAVGVNLEKYGTNGVHDTGGKLATVSLTQVENNFANFFKKSTALMELSGYRRKMKNLK
jgi:hypothetical protein